MLRIAGTEVIELIVLELMERSEDIGSLISSEVTESRGVG